MGQILKTLAAVAAIALAAPVHPVQAQTSPSAVVQAAAEALGGADRIKAVKTITLIGYGQNAYQDGGGNITGSPNAPQKYIATNDLHRVYDLEHGRFQMTWRQNNLFPFAIVWGHNYRQTTQVLDGDVAYNVGEDGGAARMPDPLDAHERRMWMLNNPVVLVREMMDPANRLSNLRQASGETLIDLQLSEGDKATVAFDAATHRPASIAWAIPHVNLGQANLTTYFVGYAPFGGLMLPEGYQTRLDWRNVDYQKIYVDDYVVDGPVPDLAAPAAVRAAPANGRPLPTMSAFKVADGIWRLTPGGTQVIEFADHLTLFELHGSAEQAKASIDFARTLVPGKPLTQLIVTHHHFDHTAGLRTAVAEGLTVISRRGNEQIMREMTSHPAPDFPDALARSGRSLNFIPVDDHMRLSDAAMTVDLYWARANTHMADALFAYVPRDKLMIEADIATAAFDYQFWPDNFMDDIEHYGLAVETVSPVHSVWPEHPETLTLEQANELIRGGVERARRLCAERLSHGEYFTGCPIPSKRY